MKSKLNNMKAKEYESRLLSKYLAPPPLPTTANYAHMRSQAREADGRGPFLPTYSKNKFASPN